MKRFCAIAVYGLIIVCTACNPNSDKQGSEQQGSDSTTTMFPGPGKPEGPYSIGKSPEINYFPDSTPKDMLPIVYRHIRDTLYGFRIGDTLHVEGDMMFIIPQEGFKAVGTNQIWDAKNNQIVIPFVINHNYTHPERIQEAMLMWKRGVNINFIDKTVEYAYVEFRLGTRSESNVGRLGKKQLIYLKDTASTGTIAHEIGHTLGLYHEHCRKDRDSFVRVLCPDNYNYGKALKKDIYAQDVGPYDYFSIMHYQPDSCLQVLKQGLPAHIPGQRTQISAYDYNGIKLIYKLN